MAGCGCLFTTASPTTCSTCLQGPWNATNDALVMPSGLNPATPSAWLLPAPDGTPLHYVTKDGSVTFKPRFEIQEASEPFFSAWPAF